MLYRFVFLCLVVCAPYINIPALFANSVEQGWLKCSPTDRFVFLENLPPQSIDQYQEKLVPYLSARGVSDDVSMENFVRKDFFHIAHALSILFEQESANVLHKFLGEQYVLVEGYNTHIDHVGRELFGPLSFYLPFLKKIAAQFGLVYLKDIVFPSTQVVKVLQQHDPDLRGVTIGRIYFQNISDGKIRCLELFQPSSLDEQYPQKIEATEERFVLLTAPFSSSSQTPIDHLALELSTTEDVQKIHDHIRQLTSEILMPYQEKISYNSGDGSTQTKVLLRDSTTTVFNKIIEFVHYER